MKIKLKISAILLLASSLFAASAVFAEGVAVIVNSSNTQVINEDVVKNIYSDRVIAWDSGKYIVVYNLPVKSSKREQFSQSVLGLSAQDAAAAESNRSITNTVRNPQKVKRERLVTSIVAKNPHAIGYVSESSAKSKSGIRILFVIK